MMRALGERSPLQERGERDPHQESGIRLQKVLASAGFGSRRQAEVLISEGRVSIDGITITELGTRVDPTTARVAVDGERVGVRKDREYILLNKPSGYITTADDPQGRRTVLDLVKSRRRLFPVGRLDADTTGLLLLTDDGDLTHRLTHPSFGVERIYVARVVGKLEEPAQRRLEGGIMLEDGLAKPARVRVRAQGKTSSQVEIVMTEGRKREVRRMLEEVGHPVTDLVRIGYGPIRLGRLPSGESRKLTPAEVGELYQIVDL